MHHLPQHSLDLLIFVLYLKLSLFPSILQLSVSLYQNSILFLYSQPLIKPGDVAYEDAFSPTTVASITCIFDCHRDVIKHLYHWLANLTVVENVEGLE